MLTPSSNSFATTKKHLLIIYILVSIGVVARLYFYFLNRSLWIDEVYLSTSIRNMSLADLLTQPLYYFQKAPLGFLVAQKLIFMLLPASEMTLRLFPLLCGTAALLLFVPAARYGAGSKMAVVAIGIFALSPPLIFHCVEAKQYATELLATVVALRLYLQFRNSHSYAARFIWGAAGAVLLWFSYAVIFVLAGMAIGLSICFLLRKNWRQLWMHMIPFGLWLVSFGLNYYIATHKHAESAWTVYWFDYYKNFAPIFPRHTEDVKWYAVAFYQALNYPLGLLWNAPWASDFPLYRLMLLPTALLLLGTWSFIKKHSPFLFFFLVLALTLLASGLKLYPLTERFWVFLSPFFLLLIAGGCGWINTKWIQQKGQWILPLLLLGAPAMNTLYFVQHPQEFILHKRSAQKEAMQYLQQQYSPGDVVYMYWNNKAGYALYQQLYTYSFPVVQGNDYRLQSHDYPSYFLLLNKQVTPLLQYKRIWLVYNDFYQTDIGEAVDTPAWYFVKGSKPTDKVLQFFLQKGKQVDSFRSFDIHAYCIAVNQ